MEGYKSVTLISADPVSDFYKEKFASIRTRMQEDAKYDEILIVFETFWRYASPAASKTGLLEPSVD